MARRYGKQDARNAILDLNHYDADDMLVSTVFVTPCCQCFTGALANIDCVEG
jgi:hypothetical protein